MADMSSSLKVVSIALVFWASLSRAAILRRILFILTLCSDRVPAISLVGWAGGGGGLQLLQLQGQLRQ